MMSNLLFIGNLGTGEIVIIALVVFVMDQIFGLVMSTVYPN